MLGLNLIPISKRGPKPQRVNDPNTHGMIYRKTGHKIFEHNEHLFRKYSLNKIFLQSHEINGVSNQLFGQQLVQVNNKANIKAPHYSTLCKGNTSRYMNSPHKGPMFLVVTLLRNVSP